MRTTLLGTGLALVVLATAAACKGDAQTAADPSGGSGEGQPVTPTKTIDRTTTATVSGAVLFGGQLPESVKIKASSDAACAKVHPEEFDAGDVLVKDGKVENAFVWVKTGLEEYRFDPPNGPVKFEQLGCMYKPRIQGARTGQEIVFTNDDPTIHNIASKPQQQKGWNFVTPQGQSGSKSFKRGEVPIRLGCDVHPWMRAWVGVVDHPFFAVTGPDGRYTFAGLPPGTYTVAAWHERLGQIEQPITVAAKETKTADFTLVGK